MKLSVLPLSISPFTSEPSIISLEIAFDNPTGTSSDDFNIVLDECIVLTIDCIDIARTRSMRYIRVQPQSHNDRSGQIDRKLTLRLRCAACKEALISKHYAEALLSLIDRRGLHLPSREICRICEQTYKSCNHLPLQCLSLQSLVNSGIGNAIGANAF